MLTGDPIPSWARLVATDTIGKPEPGRGVLRHVEDPAPADSDDGVVGAATDLRGQLEGCVDGPTADRVEVGLPQQRADSRRDVGAGPGPDRDRHPPTGGDALVGEEVGQAGEGTAAHVHHHRRGHHPG